MKLLCEYDDEEILKEAFKRKIFSVVEEKAVIKVKKKVYEDEIEVVRVPKKIYEYADGSKSEFDPERVIEENRNLRRNVDNLKYQIYQYNKYKVFGPNNVTLDVSPVSPIGNYPQHAELCASVKLSEDLIYTLTREEAYIYAKKELANEIALELVKHPEAMRIDKVQSPYDHSEKCHATIRVLLWN